MSRGGLDPSNPFFDDDDVDDDTFLSHGRRAGGSAGPGGASRGGASSRQYDEIDEIIRKRQEIENRTLASAGRSVAMVDDSARVGSETAENLLAQREKLERTEQRLDDMNQNLRASERHIKSIKSVFGSIKNYFSKGPEPPKQPPPKSVSVPSTLQATIDMANPALKKQRPEDHPGMRLRSPDTDDFGGGSNKSFDDKLDDHLTDMSAGLANLKVLARGLGDEITEQNAMLDRITDKAEAVDFRSLPKILQYPGSSPTRFLRLLIPEMRHSRRPRRRGSHGDDLLMTCHSQEKLMTCHSQEKLRRKKFVVMINGNSEFNGLIYRIWPERVQDVPDVLEDLTWALKEIVLSSPLRYLFSVEGEKIVDMEEIDHRALYVASADSRFIELPYREMCMAALMQRKRRQPVRENSPPSITTTAEFKSDVFADSLSTISESLQSQTTPPQNQPRRSLRPTENSQSDINIAMHKERLDSQCPRQKTEIKSLEVLTKTRRRIARRLGTFFTKEATRPRKRKQVEIKQTEKALSPALSRLHAPARTIFVIRNSLHKPRSIVKIVLNGRNGSKFCQVMDELDGKIKLDSGAVRYLFSSDGKRVTSLFDIHQSFVFIACGSEIGVHGKDHVLNLDSEEQILADRAKDVASPLVPFLSSSCSRVIKGRPGMASPSKESGRKEKDEEEEEDVLAMLLSDDYQLEEEDGGNREETSSRASRDLETRSRVPQNSDSDEDENDISISKIKAEAGFDEEMRVKGRPVTPPHESEALDADSDVAEVESLASAPAVPLRLPKVVMQPPFMPGATPEHLEHRFMAWNSVGLIQCYNTSEESSVNVEFHDSSVHYPMHLVNQKGHTMGTLNEKAVLLAATETESLPSCLSCHQLSSWDTRPNWTMNLPSGETVEGIALGSSFAACATSKGFLRFFSLTSIQRGVLSVPGQLVSMTAHDESLVLVYHTAPALGSDGGPPIQNLGFMQMFLPSSDTPGASGPREEGLLPISRGARLAWIGFSDEGTVATADTAGVVRLKALFGWIPIANLRENLTNAADNYFVVGLSETQGYIRALRCKGSRYPPTAPRPTVSLLNFQAPFLEFQGEKSKVEEAIFRKRVVVSIQQQRGVDSDGGLQNTHKALAADLLRHFALSCHVNQMSCALDVASTMSHRVLQSALKYANGLGRARLAEHIGDLLAERESEALHSEATAKAVAVSNGGKLEQRERQEEQEEVRPCPVRGSSQMNRNSAPTEDPDVLKALNSHEGISQRQSVEAAMKISDPEDETSADTSLPPVNPFSRKTTASSQSPVSAFSAFEKASMRSSKASTDSKTKTFPAAKFSKSKQTKLTSQMASPAPGGGVKTFQQWLSENTDRIQAEHPDADSAEISKLAIKEFKQMSRKRKVPEESDSDQQKPKKAQAGRLKNFESN
ncbi:unnamed protein product [Cyprideis torosa]|uniref:Uncharacterized protein n=1 Tax=Cyprideis torosa TaxID=163714 RepID=A0A7R8WH87_9CRUS|nr:unnamed protein product [Cyprideis torosa]CAG0892584.1 unnamed protein product [Cyprideis torosa]